MKKRMLLLFLVIIGFVALTGCGTKNSSNKASSSKDKSYIYFTDGSKLSFSELNKLEKENSYSFTEKYCGSNSSKKAEYVVGKLSEIFEEKEVDYGSKYLTFLEVEIEGGDGFLIDVEIEKERNSEVISKMKIGDYLKISNIGFLNCDCYANDCMHKLSNADAEIVK